MKISSVLEAPEWVDPEQTVGSVAKKFVEEGRMYALLKKKSDVFFVTSLDIVSKARGDPEKEKVSEIATKIKVFKEDDDIERIISATIVNSYPFAVIEKDSKIYIVRKKNMLNLFKDKVDNVKVDDVFRKTRPIKGNVSIAKARALMRNLHAQFLPVESGGKMFYLDTLSVLKMFIKKESPGFTTVEKKGVFDFDVEPFLKDDFIKVDVSERISRVAVSDERPSFVFRGDKFVGVVDVEDVLKPVLMFHKFNVNISGIRDEDEFTKSLIKKEVNRFLLSVEKRIDVNLLAVHVDRYRERGKRKKYSLHARISTSLGSFFAKSYDWDLTKAFKALLKIFEKEIDKRLKS